MKKNVLVLLGFASMFADGRSNQTIVNVTADGVANVA